MGHKATGPDCNRIAGLPKGQDPHRSCVLFLGSGTGGWIMYKLVSPVAAAVALLFLSVSFSFAQNTSFNSDMLLAYAKSYDDYNSLDTKRKEKAPYQINGGEIIRERIILHETKKSNDYAGKKGDGPLPSYVPQNGIIAPLVGNISFLNNDKNVAKLDFLSLRNELPRSVSDVAQVGLAFMTNLMLHEVGHAMVADYAGAEDNKLEFFSKQGDQFFLGTSSVSNIDSRSNLSYTMGGEFVADLTFEHALKSYRRNPGMYNKSLMFFSGTDFLLYCFYTFYVAEEHSSFDPLTISEETGLSHNALFSVILAKTALNAYRIYSGEDRVIPYFTVDKYSASLNIGIPFKNLWIEKTGLFQGSDG